MQRQLMVLRHAKSDWGTDAPTDHTRPLNKRGRKDAPRVAERLCELGWIPQYVVSSDAQRTLETYERMREVFAEALGGEPRVQFLASLYHGGTQALASALADVPADIHTVMAIGHNPGWQEAVYELTGQAVSMTTANAALLTIEEESWAAAAQRRNAWKLVEVVRPKEL